jgi:hypothetical protein
MWLNMFISAAVGTVSFVLAAFPMASFDVPVGIIGKVYANSMLVLINSRMVLGSEEKKTPLIVISLLRFDSTVPANSTDRAIEADNGDVAVDTKAGAGPSGSSEPEAV